jgi:hypothetical protein
MIRNFLIAGLTLFLASFRVAGQSEQLVINLPSAVQPGLLTFENPKGSIRVTGYDGEVILVTGTLRIKAAEKPSAAGLKKIEQNIIDISAEVNANNIIVQCNTAGKTVDFDIKVPRKISLRLKSLDNGSIETVGINGEIEIENTNGDITIENIAGSAVLSSVYGKISASFREVNPVSPMMFTSFEGDITVFFPSTINAKFKMKSEKGEIMSDFDIRQEGRQPVVKNIDNKQVYTLETWVTGSVNSGGPEYIFSSYAGNIILRKK